MIRFNSFYLTRQVSLLFILIICSHGSIFSKDKTDDATSFAIEVYFKDGTTINGYNRTDFTGGKSTLRISKEPKGKIEKYESELIDSIVFPPSANDTTRVVWIPLKAHKQPAGQKNIFSRNEFFKKPVFLMKVFTGKSITGYILPTYDATPNNYKGITTITTWSVNSYYITEPNIDYAYCYWKSVKGIMLFFGSMIKKSLKQYPDMIELFNQKIITKDEFLSDPSICYLYFDDLITNQQVDTGNESGSNDKEN